MTTRSILLPTMAAVLFLSAALGVIADGSNGASVPAAPGSSATTSQGVAAASPPVLEGYAANRQAVDRLAIARAEALQKAISSGDHKALRDVFNCWPPASTANVAALQLAQSQVQLPFRAAVPWLCALPCYHWSADAEASPLPGRHPTLQVQRQVGEALDPETISYLAGIFDSTGDRTCGGSTLLSDNQRLLDAVSLPKDAGVLSGALALIAKAEAATGTVGALSSGSVSAAAAHWQEAEAHGFSGDPETCAKAFISIAHRYPRSILAQFATLAGAQWLHYAGRYRGPLGAEQLYSEVAEAGGPVAQYGRLGLAEMAFAAGNYSSSWQAYALIKAASADIRLVEWAGYRQARCLEFLGKRAEALRAYSGLAKARCPEIAQDAAHAAKQLASPSMSLTVDTARKAVSLAPTRVRYLGEDRSTGGDWYTYYGSEAFVLCAQQAPNDIRGGSAAFQATPRAGNPQEKARYWISPKAAGAASAIYNPLARVHRAANWDDRGEAYRLGTGPDLWLDITVPAGAHRLSLYFVNDRNYYEPNRSYSVTVFNANDQYQTGTEVRWFVNGLYKQFSVAGPTALRVRISRDLSMNVLISGVFLDPMTPEPKSDLRKDGLWGAWHAERDRHLSSADEHAALSAAVNAAAEDGDRTLMAHLTDIVGAELAARRYGAAKWAADAYTSLLADDPRGVLSFLGRTLPEFATTSEVRAPDVVRTALALPIAEELFAAYLRTGAEGLTGDKLVTFYRSTAEEFRAQHPSLADLAYQKMLSVAGEDAVSAEDHFLITFSSVDKTADAARLRRLLDSGRNLTNRDALQLQLLGRLLVARRIAEAESLVAQMRVERPSADTTANAVYNLGVYHMIALQKDRAKAYFEDVLRVSSSHIWAQAAKQRIGELENMNPSAAR